MISIVDRALRKGIEREVTSHLRPATEKCQDSAPSIGNSRCKRLAGGTSLSCSERSRPMWLGLRTRQDMVRLRLEGQAGARSCKALQLL